MKGVYAFLVVAIILLGGAFFLLSPSKDTGGRDGALDETERAAAPQSGAAAENAATVFAEGLTIPWEIAFLPDGGGVLVTERPGRLLWFSPDGSERKVLLSGVGGHRGEGGLLGLAVQPDFADGRGWIYLYFSDTDENGAIENSAWQYWFAGGEIFTPGPVLEGIPGAAYHDGGRIAFGPDGYLYVATGDAGREDLAQDINSLAGKILRIDARGEVPADNPFVSTGSATAARVYSYGHRNVQGLAWDEDGQLWATEHGRSGILSGYDEVNRVVSGGNYGWPDVQGDENHAGMIAPQRHSGPKTTWAPSGMAYVNGRLVFAGLAGESLYVIDISSGTAGPVTAHFSGEFGRLRTVTLGPDGYLYVLTSNRDGRGDPTAEDDRIIKVAPSSLGL